MHQQLLHRGLGRDACAVPKPRGIPDGLDIGCAGEPAETSTADGTFSGSADVTLDLDCGELAVTTAAGSDWSVAAGYDGNREPQIDADGDSLRVSMEGGSFFPFGDRGPQEWDVVLPTENGIDLTVNANAASSRLDLDGAALPSLAIDANAGEVRIGLAGSDVADFDVNANAGSLSIDTDESTSLVGSVEMNAGSLELCAPDGVSVAITIEDGNITFSHNLDDAGLTRQGDTWSNGGGGDADVTLAIEGNAASFTFNPDGGCA